MYGGARLEFISLYFIASLLMISHNIAPWQDKSITQAVSFKSKAIRSCLFGKFSLQLYNNFILKLVYEI